MTALLDVNILIALAWPNHVHHATAWAWFSELGQEGWATCPITESGFVRVSCNPASMGHAATPLDVILELERLRGMGSHVFWPLDRSIVDLPEALKDRLQGHRQITDAVLLDAAMQRGGQLVTLDAGVEGLISESVRPFLYVIPV